MSLPRGATAGDFLTVLDRVVPATTDGPLPVPLFAGESEVSSFGWVYADPEDGMLTVLDAVPLRRTTTGLVIAASMSEAKYTTHKGLAVRVAGYLGEVSCDPWERGTYDAVACEARPADLRVEPDANRVYGQMLYVADLALDFALEQLASERWHAWPTGNFPLVSDTQGHRT